MKMYRAKKHRPYTEAVDVEKTTDHFVYIKGSRSAKSSSYESYFDTPEEAADWIQSILKDRVNDLSERLDRARQDYTDKMEIIEKLLDKIKSDQ